MYGRPTALGPGRRERNERPRGFREGAQDQQKVPMNKTIAFLVHYIDFIENLGVPYLSAVAKQRGWNVDLLVFDKRTVDREFKRIRPDIVCYSVMSADISQVREINRYLKSRYDFVSIMGGPHPTFFPDVRFEDGWDYICRGEGEHAFGEFLDRFADGGDLESVPNFGSSRFLTPLGHLNEELDALPYPDRDLVFANTELGRSRIKVFMTSRGCPFTCTYCFNNPLNEMQKGLGKRIRAFSPERVIAEIDAVRSKYPLSFIKFQDDLFSPKTSWLAEFSKLYKREVGLPFNALERLDLVTEERLALFKEANCSSLTFAIDSANPRIRRDILERGMRIDNDEIVRRLQRVRDYGIHTYTNFILGSPTSAIADELDGAEINARGRVTLGMTSTLVPYPGTAIYRYCVQHGLLDKHVTVEDGKRPIVQLMDDKQFSSIQKRSILTCFTDKEKDVLLNISTAFPVMSAIPWLRRVLYFLARHLPPNPLFVWLAIAVKAYKMDRYIYPTGMPVIDKLRFFFKAMKIESGRMWGKVKEVV